MFFSNFQLKLYRYLIENLYISCFIFKAHALQNHPKSAVLFHNFKEDVECDVLIKQEESVSLQQGIETRLNAYGPLYVKKPPKYWSNLGESFIKAQNATT